jgi:hypothetical protein
LIIIERIAYGEVEIEMLKKHLQLEKWSQGQNLKEGWGDYAECAK